MRYVTWIAHPWRYFIFFREPFIYQKLRGVVYIWKISWLRKPKIRGVLCRDPVPYSATINLGIVSLSLFHASRIIREAWERKMGKFDAKTVGSGNIARVEFNEISIREGHEYLTERAASRKPKSAMGGIVERRVLIVRHSAVRCGVARVRAEHLNRGKLPRRIGIAVARCRCARAGPLIS